MCEKFSISLDERTVNMLDELCVLYDCRRSQIIKFAVKRFFEKSNPYELPFSMILSEK